MSAAELTPAPLGVGPVAARLMRPLEALSALLLAVIVILLLAAVAARYVFAYPMVWVDEIVSLSFLWLSMLGAVIAMHRNEHLRLTLVVERVPERWRGYVQAFALCAVAATLLAWAGPAIEYTKDEWAIRSPELSMPNAIRVGSIAFSVLAMLALLLAYALRTVKPRELLVAAAVVGRGVVVVVVV